LGFDLPERAVSRWMKRAPRKSESSQRWPAFLRNHREAIAAIDFFTVRASLAACSTASLSSPIVGDAFCTSTLAGIRRASGLSNSCGKRSRESAPRFLIFDRNSKHGLEVPTAVPIPEDRPRADLLRKSR